MERRTRSLLITLALITACSDGGPTPASSAESTVTTATTMPASTTTSPEDAILTEALACDPLDERACLLPWPNDAFTVPDATTVTGRRIALEANSTPANDDGTHIDPTDQNWGDGFSPGSAVLAFVPGLDVAASGIAPSTDIGASLADDAPVVLLDTTTGQRVAYWGELDAQAPEGDALLVVHPAVSLAEGHHFVVALRNLRDGDGRRIAPSEAFVAALAGDPEPLERARAFREMFASLTDAGIRSDELYLAWEFTVASAQSLSGRLLHIRDDAYAQLGDSAPAFSVESQSDAGNVRTIDGSFEVPSYLSGDGGPGSTFDLDDRGMPVRNDDGPLTVPFRCVVPLTATEPVPAIVFGHGLLGSRAEVDGLSFAASAAVAGACATDEIGMSRDDIGNLAEILDDLSRFNQQADRMQQGLLHQQFLGRLLNHEGGFAASPAFQRPDGSPLLAIGQTQFVGNSQGGILGGAASAISTEWDRVVLGVPGINYSLLLPRSSDWPQFQTIFDAAYTDSVDRVLALQVVQLLWDRGENDGYAQHLTGDPYDGVEPKQVLLIEAFGDHQVANVATEVLARTIGATAHEPALRDGRSNDVDPLWGIAASDPTNRSPATLVLWDFGTPPPPAVNLPPSEPEYGRDPHGAGSREPLVLQQAITFLTTGVIPDVCAGAPCISSAIDD